MKIEALIRQYRLAANDAVEPYFVADEDLIDLFNEAEQEAAIRGRLIHESDDPAVCEITLSVGQATYPLHSALYELTHIAYTRQGSDRIERLELISPEDLDRIMPEWRKRSGDPEFALQGDTGIRLAPSPAYDGTVTLEGYRLPMQPITAPEGEPSINPAHHRHLYQWVLHRVFSIPDSETFDPSRAGSAEMEFTQYFGSRPDADLRRITREDTPHTVKAFWA